MCYSRGKAYKPFKSVSSSNSNNNLSSVSTPVKTVPHRRSMDGGEMKLPLFHGNRSEDPQ